MTPKATIEVEEKFGEKSVQFVPRIPPGEKRATWLRAHRDELESTVRRRLAELAARDRVGSYDRDDVERAVRECCAGRAEVVEISAVPLR